jgi:HlyD family type I secretion membrane fusion protein
MRQTELQLDASGKAGEPPAREPDSVRPGPAPASARAIAMRMPPPPPAARTPVTIHAEPAPSDSIWRSSLAGWAIIALFFGGFGYWAATAPLHGAVVAPAVVKVEGNRKSVQHLDGGIVKELRVKEGDKVKAGDVLLVLDDTQARAEFDVLSQQYLVLRATEARLKAELERAAALVPPEELKGRDGDGIWSAQRHQFESRRAALEGARKVIREKIAQLEAQIVGAQGTLKAYQAQLESVRQEMADIKPLLDKGLITRPRYLQLERAAAGVEGNIADALATIARARQAIAEQDQQMAQLDNERMTEVTRDLRDTQAKLLEVIPKVTHAKAVLSRIEIRSPYSGRVVALNVFSIGGVIAKGEKILDVVPEEDSLVVEAQVAVDDISDIRPNMRAEVHLTAYKQRITPTVAGDVAQISADRLVDPKTGQPYYVALVRLDKAQLAKLPQVHLYPGMPATVMIQTEERTAFDYLVGPLVQSFNAAFRQR